MLAPQILAPALRIARAQPAQTLTDCARQGMIGALDTFAIGSRVKGANRAADGLNGIDAGVAALRGTWPTGGAGSAADADVTRLLNECRSWLQRRKVFGVRVTGWREASINTLYWQVAWCYSCDNYAKSARQLILDNNAADKATTVFAPVNPSDPVGNPYSFQDSEYVHQRLPPGTRLFHGDARGPDAILAANGFQPRNLLVPAQYAPWFSGHGTSDTISCTTDQALAIEAGPAARRVGNRIDPPPHWLTPVLGGQVVGYVYEIDWARMSRKHSLSMSDQAVGREEVYLSIPASHILRWWVVLMDRTTFGPLVFPIPTPPPRSAPDSARRSERRQQLA